MSYWLYSDRGLGLKSCQMCFLLWPQRIWWIQFLGMEQQRKWLHSMGFSPSWMKYNAYKTFQPRRNFHFYCLRNDESRQMWLHFQHQSEKRFAFRHVNKRQNGFASSPSSVACAKGVWLSPKLSLKNTGQSHTNWVRGSVFYWVYRSSLHPDNVFSKEQNTILCPQLLVKAFRSFNFIWHCKLRDGLDRSRHKTPSCHWRFNQGDEKLPKTLLTEEKGRIPRRRCGNRDPTFFVMWDPEFVSVDFTQTLIACDHLLTSSQVTELSDSITSAHVVNRAVGGWGGGLHIVWTCDIEHKLKHDFPLIPLKESGLDRKTRREGTTPDVGFWQMDPRHHGDQALRDFTWNAVAVPRALRARCSLWRSDGALIREDEQQIN